MTTNTLQLHITIKSAKSEKIMITISHLRKKTTLSVDYVIFLMILETFTMIIICRWWVEFFFSGSNLIR